MSYRNNPNGSGWAEFKAWKKDFLKQNPHMREKPAEHRLMIYERMLTFVLAPAS
jgi:hypothetical protein